MGATLLARPLGTTALCRRGSWMGMGSWLGRWLGRCPWLGLGRWLGSQLLA